VRWSRPVLECLEDRRLLSTVLQFQGLQIFSSYAGVGFQETPVAVLQAQVNGAPDTNPADFQAQISWGDGTSSKGDLVYTGSANGFADYLIKGSHTYQQTGGNISISTTATGPDNTTITGVTADTDVFGMPSFIPGTPPAPVTPSAPPEDVVLTLQGSITLNSNAGAPLQGAQVATLLAQVNGAPDTTLSDYHAQINWGDNNGWTPGQLVFVGINGSNAEYKVLSSHVYAQGAYSIVVYVNGPDGTSASSWTATDFVAANPQGNPVLAANFANAGIWVYSSYSSGNIWQQINRNNSQILELAPDGSLVAGFGGAGLWRWTAAGGWQELSPGNAQSVVVDSSDNVLATFAGAGLWRWTSAVGWQQLSANGPQNLAVDVRGDVVAGFGGAGVWRWALAGGWQQLSPNNAQSLAQDYVGDVVANYGSAGLWRWTLADGWHELSPNNAQSMAVDPGGDVVASFGAAGLWRWTVGAGWQQVSPANAPSVTVDAKGDVFANFANGGGLWRWTASAGWQELTSTPLLFYAVDDSGNVVADFGAAGLWRWTALWLEVSTALALGVAVP
jgi:hypothetical protein